METLLENLAIVGLLLGIPSEGAQWYTTSSIDPIDDSRSAVALRTERPGQWSRAGRYRLLVLSCEQKRSKERPTLQALVAWNLSAEDLLEPVSLKRGGESRMRMGMLTRFGDEQARRWWYERVEKGNELFVTIPQDMDRFLRESERASQVALRIEYEAKGTETTVFDLTGSARIINTMEMGCNLLGESVVDVDEGPSFDDMLGSIAGVDEEQSANAHAPTPLTGPLRRTITDAIKQKVERNWSIPAGVLDASELVVTLRIQLGPDGSVRRVEIVDADGGANYRTMAESGRRAVLKASPFDALTRHVDKYEGWRDITITFSPPV